MALVCWSGGCDSTLMLYNLAQAASPEKPVRTISFEVAQISMAKEQARARKRILSWMRKRKLHIKHNVVQIEAEVFLQHGNPQAVLWLTATQALRPDEDLYVGYVRKDDWWRDWPYWSSIFTTLQNISERTGTIQMPLARTQKGEVIQRLRDLGLLDLTWWCGGSDLPKGRLRKTPCGDCSSCEDHETAVWQKERRDARCPDLREG